MDTVQNIANVVVGGGGGAVNSGGPAGADDHHNVLIKGPGGNPVSPGVGNPNQGIGGPGPMGHEVVGSRRPARSEFLSRPNWLFTHNENVLFCTALNALRFPDHNNVPRKFIEEWLADRMVTMETQWPAGSKFLSDTIRELERDKGKFNEKRDREISQRQREFHKNRKQALQIAERNYKAARTPELVEKARQEYEEAKLAAEQPVNTIEVQAPSPQEIALIELQTKIVRRLQGQTDRLGMADHLANKPYEEGAMDYFKNLQDDVLAAIADKHQEIAEEREKVETKSKQSRKRRRNQVANGVTMSGSATRVRFTNREIAMLIHWIYSYEKSEWASKIFEYYTHHGATRSAEHVRDKMRDLITRSRDTEKGGLSTMKVRTTASYFSKTSEPIEMLRLSQHDLQDFKYPEGPLELVRGGRYFDEERATWQDGPLPQEYIHRYHDEISRIQQVVKSKVMRTRDHGVSVGNSPVPNAGNPNNAMFDVRLVSPNHPILSNSYATDPEFALASSNLHEAFFSQKQGHDHKDDEVNNADQQNYITALASAALKPDTNDQYLQLVQEAHENAHGVSHDVSHDVTHDVAHDVAHDVTHDVSHDVSRDPTVGVDTKVPLEKKARHE